MKDLHEIASAEALQVTETVERFHNGYPSGFENVITGFFDREQIEDFVKEYGGTPIMLHKRDGWQMWERCDKVYEPMEITAEMYGDNYDIIHKNDYADEQEFIREFILPRLEDATDLETMAEIVDRAKSIWDSIDSIKFRDSETPEGVVIYNDGEFGWREYDTIDLVCVEWSHDTHNYIMGVIFDNDGEEEDENE